MIQIDPKTVFSLKDRIAIVTGGAIGLGKTIAEFYAAYGANIVIADVDGDGAKATAEEILEELKKKPVAEKSNYSLWTKRP